MTARQLYGAVTVGAGTVIGEGCVLGYPKEQRLRQYLAVPRTTGAGRPTVIGSGCLIFNHVIIYEGVALADGCVVEDRVRVGYDCRIGRGVRLLYGAYICDRVEIGDSARVAGFICDGAVVGARTTVMGQLIHEYTQPHRSWWEVDEVPPVIEPDTVVGFGASVIGRVRVGPRSYVAAGAVVSKDVPPDHIAVGVNKLIPAGQWSGRRLAELVRHWSTTPPASVTALPVDES